MPCILPCQAGASRWLVLDLHREELDRLAVEQANSEVSTGLEAAPKRAAQSWDHDQPSRVLTHRHARMRHRRQRQVQRDGGQQSHLARAIQLDQLALGCGNGPPSETCRAKREILEQVHTLKPYPCRGASPRDVVPGAPAR